MTPNEAPKPELAQALDQEQLVILLCSPRSGSTMLQRMIGSHSKIHTHPEPHLLTPLNFLGYYETVKDAPYDHINAGKALREFCEELPSGEADYLEAVRQYSSTLYGRVLAPTGKEFFLDKTPAYAEVWPFITKLYPNAKYVVLTRHPLAILHSYAHSFFGGDYAEAHKTNPVAVRYVERLGEFLLQERVDFVHVRYEDVVQNPEPEVRRICEHLGLPFEEEMVNYGSRKHITKSYGDPMTVEKHDKPVRDSLEKWAQDLKARPEARKLAESIMRECADEHLQAWGFPRENLFAALEATTAVKTKTSSWNSYRIKRAILLGLRKRIHKTPVASALRQVRYYCDVLLRS